VLSQWNQGRLDRLLDNLLAQEPVREPVDWPGVAGSSDPQYCSGTFTNMPPHLPWFLPPGAPAPRTTPITSGSLSNKQHKLLYDWSSHSTAGEWPLSLQPSPCSSNLRLRPRKVKSWLATGHSLLVPADPLGPSLPTAEHGMLHQLEEAGPEQENDLEGGAGLAAGSGTPASSTITITFCSNCNFAPCTAPDTSLCQRCFRSQSQFQLLKPPAHSADPSFSVFGREHSIVWCSCAG